MLLLREEGHVLLGGSFLGILRPFLGAVFKGPLRAGATYTYTHIYIYIYIYFFFFPDMYICMCAQPGPSNQKKQVEKRALPQRPTCSKAPVALAAARTLRGHEPADLHALHVGPHGRHVAVGFPSWLQHCLGGTMKA